VDRVDVVPVGPVPEDVLLAISECIRESFGMTPVLREAIAVPADAFDAKRGQHASARLLKEIHAGRDPGAVRTLGVTESDLFIPMLTFVFGQAQLRGEAAIVSLARLRQEFYGLPPDAPLLLRRVEKETLHELGHTFGVTHCEDGSCAMSLSASVHQIDTKNGGFCAGCALLLGEGRGAGAFAASEVRP
jgi:archaemetzincin